MHSLDMPLVLQHPLHMHPYAQHRISWRLLDCATHCQEIHMPLMGKRHVVGPQQATASTRSAMTDPSGSQICGLTQSADY